MGRTLTGKVIFITGASSGIGAATAEACAAAGMRVALFARRASKLRDLAARIEAAGGEALACPGSVADDAELTRALAATHERFGRLDAVFANAGYGLCLPVMGTSEQQHRDIFETNYFGTLKTLRRALPHLRAASDGLGHLLICTSAASEIGLPMYGAYAATKAAQDSIAGALRAELGEQGMHVTSVHPVGTHTEFFDTVARLSNRVFRRATPNTPPFLAQSAEAVAARIVGALRRPRPEVWPRPTVRFGLAMTTAFPRLAAWAMRRHYRHDVDCRPADDRAAPRGEAAAGAAAGDGRVEPVAEPAEVGSAGRER